jgi:hypothetical protein
MSNIIAVVPEHQSGPGWSNQTIVVIRYEDGKLTRQYLQPDEMGLASKALFNVCAAAHGELKKAVISHLSKVARKKK